MPIDLPTELTIVRRSILTMGATVAERLDNAIAGLLDGDMECNLTRLAEALGMRVVLEPVNTPFEMRLEQARKKAGWLSQMVQATSGLEAQAVDDGTLSEIEAEQCEALLTGPRRRLWE